LAGLAPRVSILDTTFFIDLYRLDAGATQIWESIRLGEIQGSYSAVTAFELWVGRLSQEESDFYDGLMLNLEEIPLTSSAARRAATWLRDLSGPPAERLIRDAMVAASAADRGEAVFTRNQRDFSRFRGVEVESH
jgi:predicted nucleic acid-binding protein